LHAVARLRFPHSAHLALELECELLEVAVRLRTNRGARYGAVATNGGRGGLGLGLGGEGGDGGLVRLVARLEDEPPERLEVLIELFDELVLLFALILTLILGEESRGRCRW
jgi:hypothetical protein